MSPEEPGLVVIGVSHHTAPVEVRERFAFAPDEVEGALASLMREPGVDEAVLLSTCNRTEIYLRGMPSRASAAARALLLRRAGEAATEATAGEAASAEARGERTGAPGETPGAPGVPSGASEGDLFYRARGVEAARHLFRVTAGLDSLVLGEAEIQGQVRDAYERAAAAAERTSASAAPDPEHAAAADPSAAPPAPAGPVLHRLFQMALSVGGTVRAETRLGHGAASVASVAVELARKVFGDLHRKRVLVVGAGETGERVVEALERHGVRDVTVVNRTLDRAEELARRLEGRARPFDDLLDALAEADVVVTSTGAMRPVIPAADFRARFPRGIPHPLLVLDLAIPRDVEAEVGEEGQVFLYNIDDLSRLVDETLDRRSAAVAEAERLVEAQSDAFRAWLAARDVVPVIRTLRGRADRLRERELRRLVGGWEDLSDEERERLEAFSKRLVNKLIHRPTARLREGAANGAAETLVEAVRYLYDLKRREPADPASPREGSPGEERAHGEGPGDPQVTDDVSTHDDEAGRG